VQLQEEERLRTQTVGWRRGAAGFAGALGVAALVAVVLLATSAGGSGGSYTVRAIFDDAGNAIPGENVKIDGVKVGRWPRSRRPAGAGGGRAEDRKSRLPELSRDASCTIEPEALLGEKFVNCCRPSPAPRARRCRRR